MFHLTDRETKLKLKTITNKNLKTVEKWKN